MHFTKMHGLGNDYLYIFGDAPVNVSKLSVKLSDRHFGAGSDGLIFISASDTADFKMRIFNADGSEARMCGNGIRCVGKYVYEKGYTDKTDLTIETLSGIKTLQLHTENGKVRRVTVDMGKTDVGEDKELYLVSGKMTVTPVSVGNPHAVIFTCNAEEIALDTLGPAVENCAAFPGGVNAEFIQVTGPQSLRMRVWERGSGITMACGTGACASAAAAVKKGYCRPDVPISVQLDGGILQICVGPDYNVTMTGPAEIVYEGETAIC